MSDVNPGPNIQANPGELSPGKKLLLELGPLALWDALRPEPRFYFRFRCPWIRPSAKTTLKRSSGQMM